MKYTLILVPGITLALLAISMPSCKTTNQGQVWEQELGEVTESPLNPGDAHKALNMQIDLIPDGKYGRRLFRQMKPQFITIHSTQNYTGDAFAHAKALKKGALRGGVCGYLCWHFTVQDDTVIQHIPTSERGEHADFDGPGNRYSIGIEMCEHNGNNQLATMERTAKLAASLMYYHEIPVQNIRAHYHWPRAGYKTPNKNCPHFLMEDGRPGDTWRWFVGRIERHYKRLQLFEDQIQEQKAKDAERERLKKMVQNWIEQVGEFIGLS